MSTLIFVLLLFIPSWCRLAEDTYPSCVTERCFHQPAEACPSPENKCRCRRLSHNCNKAAVCCNVNKYQLTDGLACSNISGNGDVEALHIRNASFDDLNLEDWWKLKYLRYMTITDGHIKSVVGEFSRLTYVSCLNLSSNGISNFENRSLVNLYNLSFLDLSRNNLTDVPRFKKDGNITLDISDNKNMSCQNISEALKRTELHFSNKNHTHCLSPRTFHWFNSTESLPIDTIIGIHKLEKDCPTNCTCEPRRLELIPGKPPTYAVDVNCFGQQWLSLPLSLPENTVALNVSRNNITSLDQFNSPDYQNIRELYADDNQITSILPLEGSKFLSNFVVLSLRSNKLKTLPTYIFSNVFDRNIIHQYVRLGLNKFHCDCNTAKVLKVWLLTKQNNIQDSDEVYCDNMDMKVVNLDPSKLCQTQQDWTDYIYYIITIEVLLLVGLVAKVVYDYCIFKTSGYLPWPASKIPKLPCDWLCE